MIEELLKGIGFGALYGIQASFYQYMAQEDLPVSIQAVFSTKFWKDFDTVKFTKTVALGAAFGAISVGYGYIKPDQWTMFTTYTTLPQVPLTLIMNFVNTGIIIAVDTFTRIIVRRTPLVKAWDQFKAGLLKILMAQDKLREMIEAETPKPVQPAPQPVQ
jgi:hypothetical protein